MAKQNWGEILKYSAILAGGFVAVYVAKKIHDGMPTKEAVKAALDKINPASDKNVVYQAANKITGGDDTHTIGTRMRDAWERLTGSDPMAVMAKRDAAAAASRVSNTSAQGTDNAKSTFRTAEISAENAPAPDKQSEFRIAELTYDGMGASADFSTVNGYSTDNVGAMP